MSERKDCCFCYEIADYNGTDPCDIGYQVTCPNCGKYKIHGRIGDEYLQYKHLISGLIREKNELRLDIGTIEYENIMSLLNESIIPKTITDKLYKILLYCYRNQSIFSEKITFTVDKYAIGYAKNPDEFINLVNMLIDLGLLEGSLLSGDTFRFDVKMSLEGIIRAEELTSTNKYTNKAFVAMGFHDDLIEAHERAIKPACKDCGFDAQLITDTEHNEGITDRIIAEIKTSRFMITDFTYNNYGAYFEAGYAQGRGLEVIRTCKKEWFDAKDKNGKNINRVHFDIQHYNFILWEDYDDLREKLYNRIRATIL